MEYHLLPHGTNRFTFHKEFKIYIASMIITIIALFTLYPLIASFQNLLEPNYSQNVLDFLKKYKFSNPYLISTEDALCSVAIYKNKLKLTKNQCLGPPYIYLTYHGGKDDFNVRSVCKYSRDGCSFGSVTQSSHLHQPHSFRGLLIDENFLLVADAWKKKSRILLYDRCNPHNQNRRELLRILVNTHDTTPPLIHPYAFAQSLLNPNHIYISTQGGNLVFKFTRNFNQTNGYTLNFDSVAASFNENDIRGVTFDNLGNLYVSNKDEGVAIFNPDGSFRNYLTQHISKPVTVYFDKKKNILWVGYTDNHHIIGYNTKTFEIVLKIKHTHLKHPAGIVIHEDSLFVVSQKKNQLLEFSATTGELLNIVLPHLPDGGERLILSPC